MLTVRQYFPRFHIKHPQNAAAQFSRRFQRIRQPRGNGIFHYQPIDNDFNRMFFILFRRNILT